MNRRDVFKGLSAVAAISAVPLPELWAAKVDSTYKGVKLGLITGSLNPLPNVPGKDPIDVIIENCLAIGAANVELVNVGGPMPPNVIAGGRFGQAPDQKTPEYLKTREELRQWRINLPLERFREVRKKFDAAGLNLFSYVYTIDDDMTRSGDRRGVPADAGAQGRLVLHQPDARHDGAAHGEVRREVQHQAGVASARRHRFTGRSRDSRHAREDPRHVEEVRREPRHRPLHGGQQRRGRLPEETSRSHQPPPHEGSQAQSRPERAARRGRHADQGVPGG